MGEAPRSSEPGCPHLSRGSGATAPRAPAAAAGLSLVPRRGGVAVSGATRRGAAAGGGGGGRQGPSANEPLCSPARPGSGAERSSGNSPQDLWLPTPAQEEQGVRTFRRCGTHLLLYRAGGDRGIARDVTATAVGGGGRRPRRGYYPKTIHGWQTPRLPQAYVESRWEEMEIKPQAASLKNMRSIISGGSGVWNLVSDSQSQFFKLCEEPPYTLVDFNITTDRD